MLQISKLFILKECLKYIFPKYATVWQHRNLSASSNHRLSCFAPLDGGKQMGSIFSFFHSFNNLETSLRVKVLYFGWCIFKNGH